MVARALDALARSARLAIGALLILMVLLNVANAFSRYVLGRSIEGSDEILVFAMVWVVFAGAALASFDRGHLRIGLIEERLPAALRRGIAVVGQLGIAALAGLVTWQSIEFVERLAMLGQTSMAGGIPMTLPHAAVTLGFALMAVAALVEAARAALGGPPDAAAGPAR